jgi:hypothetical protein
MFSFGRVATGGQEQGSQPTRQGRAAEGAGQEAMRAAKPGRWNATTGEVEAV